MQVVKLVLIEATPRKQYFNHIGTAKNDWAVKDVLGVFMNIKSRKSYMIFRTKNSARCNSTHFKWLCALLHLRHTKLVISRLQRDQEFSIPGFLGRDFAKSRDPRIFRDGISLKFYPGILPKKYGISRDFPLSA